MNITELRLAGAYLVEPEKHQDERGFFARTWCVREFEQSGIDFSVVQASISFTRDYGTLRGMHYQKPPSREAKLVRCTRGRVLDVIVDVRPDSDTFLKYEAVELSAGAHNAVLIASGLAHGFQTLEDNVELFYEMTDFYQPETAGGFRHDDPLVSIAWPLPVTVINERDAAYKDIGCDNFECFRGL